MLYPYIIMTVCSQVETNTTGCNPRSGVGIENLFEFITKSFPSIFYQLTCTYFSKILLINVF